MRLIVNKILKRFTYEIKLTINVKFCINVKFLIRDTDTDT